MTDEPDTGREPPQEWVAALDRAETDLAAGRIYDGAAVRQRLRDSIKRIQVDADAKSAQGD